MSKTREDDYESSDWSYCDECGIRYHVVSGKDECPECSVVDYIKEEHFGEGTPAAYYRLIAHTDAFYDNNKERYD